MAIEGDTLILSWSERPQPDRAGNYTLGYYVGIGTQDTVLVDDVFVEHSPYRLVLEEYGNYWGCSRPGNNHEPDPEGSCTNDDYAAPLPPLSCDDGPVAEVPFKFNGPIEHGDSTISIQLNAVPIPSPGCDGFRGIDGPISDYSATINGIAPTGLLVMDSGWYWEDAPRDGTITVEGPGVPWSITYVEITPDP